MPYLLLAIAICCLSQPANLVRWAEAPIEAIGFWRLLIAAAALAPFAWKRRASWRALTGFDRRVTFAAGALFFLHLWTFFYAAKHTRVANCMIAFSIHPLFTALGARAFFREPLTARLSVAYLLAIIGLAGLVRGTLDLGADGVAGDLAAVVSAALFSGYVLCGRRVRASLDNTIYAGTVYFTASLLFLAAGAAAGIRWTGYSDVSWLAILGLAFGVTLGGHALFTYLLKTLNVNLLSLAKLLEPLGASIVAYWAFGEGLSQRTILAFACIAAALAVIAAPSRSGSPVPMAGGQRSI